MGIFKKILNETLNVQLTNHKKPVQLQLSTCLSNVKLLIGCNTAS